MILAAPHLLILTVSFLVDFFCGFYPELKIGTSLTSIISPQSGSPMDTVLSNLGICSLARFMICVYHEDLGPVLFPNFFTTVPLRHMDRQAIECWVFIRLNGLLDGKMAFGWDHTWCCTSVSLLPVHPDRPLCPHGCHADSRFSGLSIRSRWANQPRSRLCFSPKFVHPPDDRPWFDGAFLDKSETRTTNHRKGLLVYDSEFSTSWKIWAVMPKSSGMYEWVSTLGIYFILSV